MGKPRADAAAAVAWLQSRGSARFRAGLARYGLPAEQAFGVPVGVIQKYGKALGVDHALSRELWKTGWTDARMLAAFVGDPSRVTPAEMDAWCRDFDSWGIVDTVCFKLWDRSPHAWKKAKQWAARKPEFEKRAGFVLMACLAAHDKQARDAEFLKFMPLIEKGAGDDRNFVKKGVLWALRMIGRRSLGLNAAAMRTAKRLAASDGSSARWVGRHAARELARERSRLARSGMTV